MAETGGDHRFVSMVQVGVGLTPSAGTIEVAIDGAGPVSVPASSYGPGDVRALDGAAVTRVVPPANTPAFEPNLFASVELAHPALPWALSPSRTPRLPWLALVVVEDGPGVRVDRSGPIAVLVLEATADLERELPDLAQSWAWVHAHGTGPAGAPIAPAQFGHSDEPTCARLLCPRRLEPRRGYHAALVPVFAAGVRAALGDAVGADDGALAWTAGTALPLRLPVYHLWSFTTGEGGDFASLARQLKPRTVEASVGVRALDAADPGWGFDVVDGRTIAAHGVLRPQDTTPPAPSPAATALGLSILELIDAAATTAAGDTPSLPPPFYGSAPTAITRSADAPPWLVRTNRDIALRIAAGAGAAIVRARQEELVASAWHQLGDAEAANQVLRHTEVAAAVNQRLSARYVEAMPDEELVQVIRPAHRRMRLADARGPVTPGNTLAADIEESALPSGGATAAFRRLTRAGGRIARRGGATIGGVVLDGANRGALEVVPPRAVPDGGAAFDEISELERAQPRYNSARAPLIAEAATHWKQARTARPAPTPTPAGGGLGTITSPLMARAHVPVEVGDWVPPLTSDEVPDPPVIDAFSEASQAHQRYLVEHLGAIRLPRPRPPLVRGRMATVRERYRHSAAPTRTVMPVVAARVLGHTFGIEQPFRRITITPSFDRPLLRDLAALDLGHVLPGIDRVDAESIVLLEPDHAAVAAVLAGANHELAAELRWRGFPGAERDTYLRTFWGRTARDASGALVTVADVPPIDQWPNDGPVPPPVGLVLLLRGELLRHYPNAFIYLAEARWSGAHRVINPTQRLPLFQCRLGADAVLYGFDLDRAAVAGGTPPGPPRAPGWYVVIEEHPQEPRFGLGAGADTALRTWRDLTWAHVVEGDLRGGTHLAVGGPLATRRPTDEPTTRWGVDSAQQAAITLRRPTRIAIHASLLVTPG